MSEAPCVEPAPPVPEGVRPEQWALFLKTAEVFTGHEVGDVAGAIVLHCHSLVPMIDCVGMAEAMHAHLLRVAKDIDGRRAFLAALPEGGAH